MTDRHDEELHAVKHVLDRITDHAVSRFPTLKDNLPRLTAEKVRKYGELSCRAFTAVETGRRAGIFGVTSWRKDCTPEAVADALGTLAQGYIDATHLAICLAVEAEHLREEREQARMELELLRAVKGVRP